ncbi:MAG: class I SAM-dependent methyltransferase [Candidatus Wallbacteria bacterium]|nr:class I SAM-dependent methyltransferase [Candidatus Wallbacteria bacterium]
MQPIYGQYSYIYQTYDAQHADRPDLKQDVLFYTDLALEAGGRVLEVGCGTGRVLLAIKKAGIDVWGLDISEGMLELLRAKAKKLGFNCKLHVGDMRNFKLERKFRLILLPFRVFQHMLKPADQLAALGNLREHLLPGGRLALNIFNADVERLTRKSGQPLLEGSFTHPVSGRRVLQFAATVPDWGQQVIHNQMMFHELDPAGKVVEQHVVPLSMRWTYRWEFEHLASRAGFTVESLHGGFDRSPFTAGSGEQVWVLKR